MPDGFRLKDDDQPWTVESWDKLRPEEQRDMIRCNTGCNKASGVGFDGGMADEMARMGADDRNATPRGESDGFGCWSEKPQNASRRRRQRL